MKLCLLLGGNEEGGLEQHFVNLSNGLATYYPDLEIMVIAHEKYRTRFSPSIHFEPLPMNKSRRNLWLLFRMVQLLRRFSPDIIHAHANKAAAILSLIRKFVPGKKIATVHSQKKNNKMYQQMDFVIGVSQTLLNGLDLDKSKKQVVYNGVRADFDKSGTLSLTRSDLSIQNNLPIVVCIGRLVPVKGVDVLIRAWANVNANLLLVGEGNEKQTLEKLVLNDAEIKNVQFLGYREDIAQLLKLADLTIISSYREGFSYVVAESLLMETPVFSTNVPVANEILPKEYIVEVGAIDELRRLMVTNLTHLEQLNEKFRPLYQMAKIEFNEALMFNKTYNIYCQVLHITEALH